MPSTSQPSSSKICCEICIEEKQSHEMFTTQGCSHSFCSICISRHVDSKLQDNIINISCPGVGCNNMFEPEPLKSIVPPDVIARWEHQLSESTILPSQKYYCPYTDCMEVLVNDEEEGVIITQSECPNCWRLFCAQCKVPWHQGFSCSEFKRSKQDKRGAKELRLLAKMNKWKKCTNCKYYVEKTEGCIHITCRFVSLTLSQFLLIYSSFEFFQLHTYITYII